MKLLYPTALELEGLVVTLHPYDVTESLPEALTDAEILVTWSNSAAILKDAAERMPNLRRIHWTSCESRV